MIEFKVKGFNIEADIAKLRKEYPGFYYEELDGGYTHIKYDLLPHKEWSDWEVKDDYQFRVASDFDHTKFLKLSSIERIEVTLANGKSLGIIPAHFMPRKIMFGKPKSNETFDKSTKYGKLAFEFFQKLQQATQIEYDDSFMEFIETAITSSYSLPMCVLNYIGISDIDLEPIFMAALGVDTSKKN